MRCPRLMMRAFFKNVLHVFLMYPGKLQRLSSLFSIFAALHSSLWPYLSKIRISGSEFSVEASWVRCSARKRASGEFTVVFLTPHGIFRQPRFAANLQKGDLQILRLFLAFGQDKDVLTIEIESVNSAALHELVAQGKTVHPAPDILGHHQGQKPPKAILFGNGPADIRL